MDRADRVCYTPIVLGYIERDGAVLLSRRAPGTPLAGCWEFPGGKVEAGETLAAALRRELREELGIEATVGEELAVTRYAYPEIHVELHVLRVTHLHGEPAPCGVADVRWIPFATLHTVPFPPANAALVAQLQRWKSAEESE